MWPGVNACICACVIAATCVGVIAATSAGVKAATCVGVIVVVLTVACWPLPALPPLLFLVFSVEAAAICEADSGVVNADICACVIAAICVGVSAAT